MHAPNHDDYSRPANAIVRLHHASAVLHEAVLRMYTLLATHFPAEDEDAATELAAIETLLHSFHPLATPMTTPLATPPAPPQQ
jgi:hypothetical protein